jgi:hypothetical protein
MLGSTIVEKHMASIFRLQDTGSSWYPPTRLLRCLESKDTSRVGRQGNFLCLVWQHCCWPWSFTCKLCLSGGGKTGFVWVRCVWNGSTHPKSHQMRGVFHHMVSQRKGWTSSRYSHTNCCCLWWHYQLAKCNKVVPWILQREDWCSSQTKEW